MSLGDHVRAVRLERGLLQVEVAQEIGVERGTINKWECNRGEPTAPDIPRIIRFLGYDPLPEAETLQDRMKAWRQRAGLSATAAAKRLGVGKATWAAWERGAMTPSAESREAIENLMNHVDLP